MSDDSDDEVILLPPSPGTFPSSSAAREFSVGASSQRTSSLTFRTLHRFLQTGAGSSSRSLSQEEPPLPSLEISSGNRIPVPTEGGIHNNIGVAQSLADQDVVDIEDSSRESDVIGVESGSDEVIGVESGSDEVIGVESGSDVEEVLVEEESTSENNNEEGSEEEILETDHALAPVEAAQASVTSSSGDGVPSAVLPSSSEDGVPGAAIPSSSGVVAPVLDSPQRDAAPASVPVIDTPQRVPLVDTPQRNVAPREGSATPALPGPSAVRALSVSHDSPADFRSPKRRRVDSSESDKKSGACSITAAVSSVGDEEDEDGNTCPICFEEWTTSGNHRLASLRCGHLFGQSCIDKWLRGQGGKCPQCNAKAKRQDIRLLYAKSIQATDTSERDRALQELEKEKEARRRCEMEAAQTRLQCQLSVEECNRLKAELERVRQTVQSLRSQSSSSSLSLTQTSPTRHTDVRLSGMFVLEKTLKIWEAGNCRVMDHSASLATLVVSQPSASPLFPGFGIKKISTIDFKTSQYLTLHTKPIRDVCFNPCVDDGMLLSASMDKTVKMTSVLSNTVVHTYETPQPAWSCVWNTDDRNYFYSGQSNGTVLEFDIRNTGEHVRELNTEGHRSPVVSLVYVPRDPQAMFRPGGLLVGQLAQVSFYERKSDDQYRLHMLPLDGALSSLCFEPTTRNLLASFKPNSKYPTTRHQMCELTATSLNLGADSMCTCNVIQTFHGGRTQTMLSRSLLLPHPADVRRLLVCAGEESSSAMHVWDCGTGQMIQRLSTGGVVVDICAIRDNQHSYVAALTDKQIKVHKWG